MCALSVISLLDPNVWRRQPVRGKVETRQGSKIRRRRSSSVALAALASPLGTTHLFLFVVHRKRPRKGPHAAVV
jgi:hypothetical protein